MAPKPPEVFPGEKGFALLEHLGDGYSNRGKITGCRYRFAQGQRRYVDVRDMGSMERGAFVKVGREDSDSAGEGTQDAPQLVGDSEGGGEDA